jgi:hypothetical protein
MHSPAVADRPLARDGIVRSPQASPVRLTSVNLLGNINGDKGASCEHTKPWN